jgi:anaerobic selenocysteine-containing dehydrogenase
MRKENGYTRCHRIAKVFWHFKSFHYSNWGYALLITLCSIYILGGIHYEYLESDIKIEEVNYNNSLKEEVHTVLRNATESKDFVALNQKWKKYKNQLLVMVQDYYNFKMYFDSHEAYQFVTSNKHLEYFLVEKNDTKYEVNIYSLRKQKWKSVYKHWLKYFSRSIKSSSKYNYLTVWLICLYPLLFISFITAKAWFRIKRFAKSKKSI